MKISSALLASAAVVAFACNLQLLAEEPPELEILFSDLPVATQDPAPDLPPPPVPTVLVQDDEQLDPFADDTETDADGAAADQDQEAIPAPQPESTVVAPPLPACSAGAGCCDPFAAPPLPKAELWAGYCDGCDHSMPCIDPCPAWLTVEAVFLQRDQGDNRVLAFDGNPPNNVLMSTDQFDFRHETGGRVSYMRYVGGHLMQVSYTGVHEWQDSVTRTGLLDAAFADPALGAFQDATSITARYKSDLNNIELNLFQNGHGGLMWLAGVRYFNLEDDFQMTATDGVDNGSYQIAADNHLIGGQVGGLFHWENCEGWYVDGSLKLGLFANSADVGTQFADTNVGVPAVVGEAEDTELSFISDLSVALGYNLGAGFSIRGGYQLLWASNVALATEHVAQSNAQLNAAATIDAGHTLFVDGAFIGIEWVH